ncbi:MAG: hypothetical protein AAGA63_04190 [Pseudomonadota bacterium]
MSRKDTRKSIVVVPDGPTWNLLRAHPSRSMSDAIRRLVAGVDWMAVTPAEPGQGAKLSVQLPQTDAAALGLASEQRGISRSRLLLGALRRAIR